MSVLKSRVAVKNLTQHPFHEFTDEKFCCWTILIEIKRSKTQVTHQCTSCFSMNQLYLIVKKALFSVYNNSLMVFECTCNVNDIGHKEPETSPTHAYQNTIYQRTLIFKKGWRSLNDFVNNVLNNVVGGLCLSAFNWMCKLFLFNGVRAHLGENKWLQ